MKLRSKLLLSATCLLTISVAATATSAYAWFTANRQASVAISQADVKTNATNLYIKGVGGDTPSGGDTVSFAATDKSHAVSGAVSEKIKATDISGDGKAFFKPKLDPNFLANGMATVIDSVSNSTEKSTYYYHQFRFVFTQSNNSVNTGVYFGSGSTLSSSTITQINPSLRASFLVNNEVKLRWAPNGIAGQTHYLKKATTSSAQIQKVGETALSGDHLGAIGDLNYQETPTTDINDENTITEKSNSKYLLGQLNTSNKSLEVTVRVWFEGMDSACIAGNIASDVAASLNFYGVNMVN